MLILNSHNVVDYLTSHNLYDSSKQTLGKVELLKAKNFNLLITLSQQRKLLVKQERQNIEGEVAGEFKTEYRIQEWLKQFPQATKLADVFPELLHYDDNDAIIIFNYLDDYQDLSKFYLHENNFPVEIASNIGTRLATIHRHTHNQETHRQFFLGEENSQVANQVSQSIRGLEKITPEIFGAIPVDGLKFFALYQKYDSLGIAIADLREAFTPSCLTHNDLKLNNILLHVDWQQNSNHNIIRLIDWERSAWGDPAFDLGTLVASYIQIWLGSLVISKSLSIEESLNLAVIPLAKLQPSIAALTKAYLNTFPEILETRPDFLPRVVQFAGLGLIQQIQAGIQYQKTFGNIGIAMLQVAKSLLCRPERSMPTLFGTAIMEIAQLFTAA